MKWPNLNKFDLAKMFTLQDSQWQETLLLRGIIPANTSNVLTKINISALGHFKLERITGRYDTLNAAAGIVDDGVSYLTGKLVDGATQKQLFSDLIPLEIFLSPGRTRSPLATNNLTTAAPSQALFYPFDFSYLFSKNSDIQLYVSNTSSQDLSIAISFIGWRIRG